MSLNYEHISEEGVTDLICSLLSEWENKQNERIRDGEDPDCPEWQDLVNASREFIEVATMNNPMRSAADERKQAREQDPNEELSPAEFADISEQDETMSKYRVLVKVYVSHEVDAENEEDAIQQVQELSNGDFLEDGDFNYDTERINDENNTPLH